MGFGIPFTMLVSLLLFLFMVTKIVKRAKPRKLPPGPWKLPIIGNMHQLAAGGSLIHHTLRDLAMQHGPIMCLHLGEVPTIVLSSPELAKEVFKTHDLNLSNRPCLVVTDIMSYHATDIIFSPHGTYWRQLRKICVTELLTAKRVQSFRAIREEESSRLVRTISSGKEASINLSELIFSLTYSITSRTAFGNKWKEQERFVSIIGKATKLASGFSLPDMYPSLKVLQVITGVKHRVEKLHRELEKLFENIIDHHKEEREGLRDGAGEAHLRDLVDVLLDLQEHGNLESPLSDNTIKAVIFDIFSAGSETSAAIVEWAMSEMLKTPRLMEEAQSEVRRVFDGKGDVDEAGLHELKFLTAIIKETLRLHPSLSLLGAREPKNDLVLGGYDIPAGARVFINGWAIGRDPKYWSEPDRFYPERFLDSSVDYKGTHYEFIPFGGGRRICPGILYAEANIQLPLATLLYHFDWQLPNGKRLQDLDMTEAFGLTVRRKEDLVVVPYPYGRSSLQ